MDTVHVSQPHRLQPAADISHEDRETSLAALQALEEALSAPAPGREAGWLAGVIQALDLLVEALDAQASGDAEAASLLSEIATEEPRLAGRIQRLRDEHRDLRDSVSSLRAQIEPQDQAAVDVADIRDRLAAVARRFRQHRSREADLTYDAVNITLGAGD